MNYVTNYIIVSKKNTATASFKKTQQMRRLTPKLSKKGLDVVTSQFYKQVILYQFKKLSYPFNK